MNIDTDKENAYILQRVKKEHKVWQGSYVLLALASLGFYFLVRLNVFDVLGKYHNIIQRWLFAGFLIFIVLAISKYTQAFIVKHNHAKAIAYNIIRLVHILAVFAIIMIVVAVLFENWYTAAVSLGLFSLVLGFALQTPISSFIGWLYIIIRIPYKVGDRVQITGFKGDVVEIGYLDTTLWEFSGDALTYDLPSGRLIRFPNTLVLQCEVYNYSWRKFPYVWNEITFDVAYESDFAFVENILRQTTKEILGPTTDERVKELKHMVQQTPVDEMTTGEYPFITLRTNTNTWLEVTVNYLVDPKNAAAMRSAIIRKAIPLLLQEPARVMFPKANAR
jgi:small-conductance mechanosensitive channel